MPEPRRHHFLPRWYLQSFCKDNSQTLYVYERGKKPRKSTAASEAHVRDLYAYEGQEGKDFSAEKILAQHENVIAPISRNLVDLQGSKEYRLLTEFERFALAEFAGLMFTRNPAGLRLGEEHVGPRAKELIKKAALDPPLFAKQMRAAFDDSGMTKDQIERRIEEARQHVLAGYLDRPESPEIRLEAMFAVGLMIANSLKKKDCEIVFATRHEAFITGDMPVGTQSTDGFLGTSFAKSDTHVWLPLSRKLCVHWPRPPDRHGWARMPPRAVRMLNRNVMRYAERYIYAGSYSMKLAETFSHIPQALILGKTAFIPPKTLEEIEDIG